MESLLRRRTVLFSLYLLFWTLFTLYFTSETYIFYQTQTTSLYSFWFMFLLIVPEGAAWVPLGLFVLWFARRFPITRSNLFPSLGAHAAVSILVALIHSVIHAYLAGWIGVCQQMPAFAGRPLDLQEHILFNLTLRFHRNILTYGAIVGLTQGVRYYIAYRDRLLQESILEKQLAEARFQAVQLQLQPHFLFNTMHTVSSLIHTEPDTAQRMLVRLSELLRLTLTERDVQEHPLKDELSLVEKYLEIEKIRFDDKLNITLDITDETRNTNVPNLILQPLVENSIKHGIERSSAPGTISISSRTKNDTVVIEIRNTGPIRSGPKNFLGIGLSATTARLHQLYGNRSSFRLFEQEGSCVAELIIPART